MLMAKSVIHGRTALVRVTIHDHLTKLSVSLSNTNSARVSARAADN
jgi:hypothetical protein